MKISVIVPCYNVEQYIDRCIESIVDQTIGIEELEIILVNDASTDSTLEKLFLWEKEYPDNIMVITYEKNIRQGGARNVGLQYATADYIGFVDADDWLETDMYEKLYDIAMQGDYDVVRGKYIQELGPEDAVDFNKNERHDVSYVSSRKGDWYYCNIDYTGNNGEFGGLYTGIYKRNIIFDNNVFFPENTAYEDNYWGIILKLYIKNLYIIDQVLYHYRNNLSSTVHDPTKIREKLNIEVAIVEEFKRIGAFDTFYKELEKGFLQRYFLNGLYAIFVKFAQYNMNISFSEMKNKVWEYFPTYKNCSIVRECSSIQRLLFMLLDMPRDLADYEIMTIKEVYIVYMLYAQSIAENGK